MNRNINWFGLVAGIFTLVVVIASVYVPWWQVSVGQIANVNLSPVNTNLEFAPTSKAPVSLSVPLLWAAGIIGFLFLLTSGIVMLIYSVIPNKPYSKHLLGFAWKKPLIIVILFIIPVIAIPLLIQSFLNINIPINGASTIAIPTNILGSQMSLTVDVVASLLWTFWLAIVAAALCIAAKIYHRKVAFKPDVKPVEPAPAEPTPPTPVAPPAPSPEQPEAPVPPTEPPATSAS